MGNLIESFGINLTEFTQKQLYSIQIIEVSVEILILLGLLLFIIFIFYKLTKNHEHNIKNITENIKKEYEKNNKKYINNKYGKEAIDILDKIITDKYQFYLYKYILPVYLGSNKSSPMSKEKFKNIKEQFFIEIMKSVSPNITEALYLIYSTEGLMLYINEKFITLFNKTDSKFLNSGENIYKNNDVKDEFFIN